MLINGVSEAIKDETKELKGGLLGTLLSTWDDILLENLLAGKKVKSKITGREDKIPGQRVIGAREGTVANVEDAVW